MSFNDLRQGLGFTGEVSTSPPISQIEIEASTQKISIGGYPCGQDHDLILNMRNLEKIITARIRTLIKEKGLNLSELSAKAEMTQGYLNELMNLNPRKRWNADHIQKVANALKVPAWQLFTDPDEVSTSNLSRVILADPRFVDVIGEVQAGVWFESTEWGEDDRYKVPAPTDSPYSEYCYGLCVKGDSMDKVYAEGTVLIVLPLVHYPRELQSGDNVIVHRTRHGIVEATVKEYCVEPNGEVLLWPRSNNSKYQEPVDLHAPKKNGKKSDVELVEITAVVIGSYRMEKKI